jgi:putative ABC transport system permease protein
MIHKPVAAMCTFWSEIRYCLRGMARQPWFTTVVVLTLALGIGAACAIFSVVSSVLLQPLPFPEPERLMAVWERNLTEDHAKSFTSPGVFADLKEQSQVFAAVGAFFRVSTFLDQDDGEVVPLQSALVSPSMLQVLDVEPLLGRKFEPDDWPVVILSHDCWRRCYGSDPEIIGRRITLKGMGREVIGIMPDGIELAPPIAVPGDVVPSQLDVWTPYTFPKEGHDGRIATVVARLQSGITLAQAEATVDQIARRNARLYPETNTGWDIVLVPLKQEIVGEIRPQLLILLGAVGLLLIIACVNVANLLLARGSERRAELAIRVALGAGRASLLRQLLLESQVLAMVGGAAGLAVAAVATRVLLRLAPPEVPRLQEAGVDLRVVAFAIVISMLAGGLSGLVPALRGLSADPVTHLGRRATAGGGGVRLRSALVMAEISLSVVLLVGAGLLCQSFFRLRSVDPGFRSEDVLTMRINVHRVGLDGGNIVRQLEERVALLPQVERVGFIRGLPLTGFQWDDQFIVGGEQYWAALSLVSPGYLPAMGIPLLQGRLFSERDWDDPKSNVIVNRSFARRYLGNQSPIGMRMTKSDNESNVTIIGVVGDVRHSSLRSTPIPTVYLMGASFMSSLVVRSSSPLPAVERLVKEQIRRVEPRLPVWDVRPLSQVLDDSLIDIRFLATILVVFAGTALLLAAVGVFGIMSFVVSKRTSETGIRMALGAQRRDIFRLMIGRGILLVLAGTATGLAVALATTRVLAAQLFAVSATDPLTLTAVSLVLTGVALLACYLPARRATRIDPAQALRCE